MAKIFIGMYEAKFNFRRDGGGILEKLPSMEEVWIFFGKFTLEIQQINCNSNKLEIISILWISMTHIWA